MAKPVEASRAKGKMLKHGLEKLQSAQSTAYITRAPDEDTAVVIPSARKTKRKRAGPSEELIEEDSVGG